MTNAEVHEALIRWINGITGLTVIKAHQSGDRPPQPYIMVDLTAIADIRVNPRFYTYEGDEDITAAPVMDTEWRFQVHAYGDEPSDILRPLRSAWRLGQKHETLWPLVIHETGRINDVPEWVQNAWEQRAVMDVFVHGLTQDGFAIDVIEQAGVTFDGRH